jgi:hypothetical protein
MDFLSNNRKVKFARFSDDVCGLCPAFPNEPVDAQFGHMDKLASGYCKTWKPWKDADGKSDGEWNSFMFKYGEKLTECRIDVFNESDCEGPIISCK